MFAPVGQAPGAVFGGGAVALVVTFVVATLFYAVTLHLAAVFFLGDVPSQLAVKAAVLPALTSLLLQQWGPGVVVPVTLLGDLVAIRFVYEVPVRSAAVLTLFHFAFSVALIVPLNNIFQFV